jgi:hypothetical protein
MWLVRVALRRPYSVTTFCIAVVLMADAEHPAVQRLQRARLPDHAVVDEAVGAGGVRLCAKLSPPAPVHHSRPDDASTVRRIGAPGERRHRSAEAGGVPAVAVGRGQRRPFAERHPAGGLGAHRAAQLRRRAQLEPGASTLAVVDAARGMLPLLKAAAVVEFPAELGDGAVVQPMSQ